MRIAIFGDIHGNSIALDAVLDDIKANGGVDAYWLLGDYVAIGHDPVGCLERINDFANATYIRGNTDRYISGDLSFNDSFIKEMAIPDKALSKLQMRQGFAWTQGAITAAGWLDWCKALPTEYRTTLADGTNFLAVHASPGKDDSAGLYPGQDESELAALFGKDDAELICVGHTHVAIDRQFQEKRLINTSSVSNPFPPDLDANYLILENDETSHSITRYFVAYDHEAVINAVQNIHHPAAEYILAYMLGKNVAPWME